jgi:glyoxylase-like metal-dependent hydrolase (beta-lactamase superfamily II)
VAQVVIENLTADAEQFTCNAYLVGGEQPALVDAGTMPGIAAAVRERIDRLDAVVLTHQHHDHVARLDEVLDAFDPTCYAHGDHPRRDERLEDGDTVQMGDETFDVVHTPGHADDHVSLVSERTLFSGDVVVYNDGAFADGSFGRTDMAGQSRERLIESLHDLLERLPDSVGAMYAGHGDPFVAGETADESVREVITRALTRAERREPKYPDE